MVKALHAAGIEVIAVGVREQDRVDDLGHGRHLAVADEVRDPLGHHGIGEEPHPADVEERRRVPEPGGRRARLPFPAHGA